MDPVRVFNWRTSYYNVVDETLKNKQILLFSYSSISIPFILVDDMEKTSNVITFFGSIVVINKIRPMP